MDELVEHDVKMLVIACNTATAAVLADARERYSVPVLEVIKPAVRRAVSVTHNKRIGVDRYACDREVGGLPGCLFSGA